MDASEADQRLQQSTSQYPLPPSTSAETAQDFAQTAAAALLSAPPSGTQHVAHQHPDVQHVSATSSNPRKRKPAIPGSRGVANLTPEQLAKKRANDREAQRAIRERTKTQIDTLMSRIRELESQQPYQEMQRAIIERDRALAECEELRRRLSAVAGIVGSQDLGQMGLNRTQDVFGIAALADTTTELAALTAQQAPLPTSPDQSHSEQYREDVAMPQFEAVQAQPHLHPELRASHNLNGSQPTSPG